MVDVGRIICRRARVDYVELEGHKWYAVICTWLGEQRACTRVNVTTLMEPEVEREAERLANDECYGDEECIETYWDRFLEEAEERLAESDVPYIIVKEHEEVLKEQACGDLVTLLAG